MDRQVNRDRSADIDSGIHFQLPIQYTNAFPHADEPDAGGYRLRVESPTVIPYQNL